MGYNIFPYCESLQFIMISTYFASFGDWSWFFYSCFYVFVIAVAGSIQRSECRVEITINSYFTVWDGKKEYNQGRTIHCVVDSYFTAGMMMDCGHIFFFLSKGITVTVNWEITEMVKHPRTSCGDLHKTP